MLERISKIIKTFAYIFFAGYLIREIIHITINTSYLNTGKILAVESMFLMIWACFIGFLFSVIIYGLGVIVESLGEKNS